MGTLDCRGLACPQPVLRTKQFIESNSESAEVSVVVDNSASAQNVVRFLESRGFSASVQQSGDDFEIKAQKSGEGTLAVPEAEIGRSAEKTLARRSRPI